MDMILPTEPWNKVWAQQLKEQGLRKKTDPFQARHPRFLQGLHRSPSLAEPQFLICEMELKLHSSQVHCTIKQCLVRYVIPTRLSAYGDSLPFPQEVMSFLCREVCKQISMPILSETFVRSKDDKLKCLQDAGD